jgi:hypothetical protein
LRKRLFDLIDFHAHVRGKISVPFDSLPYIVPRRKAVSERIQVSSMADLAAFAPARLQKHAGRAPWRTRPLPGTALRTSLFFDVRSRQAPSALSPCVGPKKPQPGVPPVRRAFASDRPHRLSPSLSTSLSPSLSPSPLDSPTTRERTLRPVSSRYHRAHFSSSPRRELDSSPRLDRYWLVSASRRSASLHESQLLVRAQPRTG